MEVHVFLDIPACIVVYPLLEAANSRLLASARVGWIRVSKACEIGSFQSQRTALRIFLALKELYFPDSVRNWISPLYLACTKAGTDAIDFFPPPQDAIDTDLVEPGLYDNVILLCPVFVHSFVQPFNSSTHSFIRLSLIVEEEQLRFSLSLSGSKKRWLVCKVKQKSLVRNAKRCLVTNSWRYK